jgi:hypothetical protein
MTIVGVLDERVGNESYRLKYHGFSRALLILTALAVPVATSSAQGPTAAGAFDGKYVGTATVTGGHYVGYCVAISSMDMTITGGQVVIHEIGVNGAEYILTGSVDAAGEVSAIRPPRGKLFGTIRDKMFKGERTVANDCYYSIQMARP